MAHEKSDHSGYRIVPHPPRHRLTGKQQQLHLVGPALQFRCGDEVIRRMIQGRRSGEFQDAHDAVA